MSGLHPTITRCARHLTRRPMRHALQVRAVAAPPSASAATSAGAMRVVEVDLGDRTYPIYIGRGEPRRILPWGRTCNVLRQSGGARGSDACSSSAQLGRRRAADVPDANFGSQLLIFPAGLLDQGELLRKHIPGKTALIVTNETIAPLYLDRCAPRLQSPHDLRWRVDGTVCGFAVCAVAATNVAIAPLAEHAVLSPAAVVM